MNQPIPLSQLRRGQQGTLAGNTLEEGDADTLRAMGLRPDCRLTLCRHGQTCIVNIGSPGCDCRIGLTRSLAERLLVAVNN